MGDIINHQDMIVMNMQTGPDQIAEKAAEQPAPRQVQRVRHELKRRDVQVLRVANVSPHFKRVTFGGEAVSDFVSASFDDHVKAFFPAGADTVVGRDYTPRRFDNATRELDIEFALHGDGPAANWAQQAAPGQRLTIGGPRGSFVVPTDFDWHLLVGDDTALPAVARRLEELPAGSLAIVLLQVDEADQRTLESRAEASVQWLPDSASLLAAVRALSLPPGFGYAWCAGEASVAAELRRIIVGEKAHDPKAIRAAAYWKRGAIAHHENLDDAR